jgi:hypothetical protein
MNNISFEDVFLVNTVFDVQSPYDSGGEKLYLDVKRSFSENFSDDKTFCGVFFEFTCSLSGKDGHDKQEEKIKYALTYFIPVRLRDFNNEKECKNKIRETLAPIIETQINNDLNYLLLKAKYPPLTMKDTIGFMRQDPSEAAPAE